ncbi:MAG: amidohydrolase [Mycobacterium sp.]|nr:MAG: amidohydrolase [Mycobacterium sp.]
MTHRAESLAAVTGLDYQAGANAGGRAHHPGQSVRVAEAWIDTLHSRRQRRAERHPRAHRAA